MTSKIGMDGFGIVGPSTAMITPVEDLVKEAIKEALAKRGVVETPIAAGPTETAATVEPVVAKPAKKVELLENQVWAKDLFKGVIAFTSKDNFPVTVFSSHDFDEKVSAFIPKVNTGYTLNKEDVISILKGWELGDKTLIYGPTGAGKSSVVEQLCAWTGRPFIRINCTGDMDSSMIFGQLTAKDGATHWQDGSVTEAVKYGAVFAWDEWDVTPPEIGMGLQWLLEEEGKLYLKEMPGSSVDKFITPHKDFRLVAIGNTQGQGDDTGQFSGTNVQNTATLDRFGTVIQVGYMLENDEVSMILKKFPEFPEPEVRNLVRFSNLVRQGYQTGQINLTMSPRSNLGICKKVEAGYDLGKAVCLVYINKLSESHQKVTKELFRKIYGTSVKI